MRISALLIGLILVCGVWAVAASLLIARDLFYHYVIPLNTALVLTIILMVLMFR